MHTAVPHDTPSPSAAPTVFDGDDRTVPDARATPLLAGMAAGRVRYHLDIEEFDFRVDVAPDTPSRWVALTLTYLNLLGYEPIPLDECEAELLDDGWVRRYLVPIEPVEDHVIPEIVAPRVGA